MISIKVNRFVKREYQASLFTDQTSFANKQMEFKFKNCQQHSQPLSDSDSTLILNCSALCLDLILLHLEVILGKSTNHVIKMKGGKRYI